MRYVALSTLRHIGSIENLTTGAREAATGIRPCGERRDCGPDGEMGAQYGPVFRARFLPHPGGRSGHEKTRRSGGLEGEWYEGLHAAAIASPGKHRGAFGREFIQCFRVKMAYETINAPGGFYHKPRRVSGFRADYADNVTGRNFWVYEHCVYVHSSPPSPRAA